MSGTWYFFYDSGAMAANTRIGGSYVNGSGAWVPGYGQSSSGTGSSSSSGWDGVTVYWTQDGKRYHKSRTCPTIKNRTTEPGILSEAQANGLSVCHVCG